MHAGLFCRNLQEGDTLEEAGLEGRIILKWILERKARRAWTEVIFLTTGSSARLVCRRYLFSVSIRCGEFHGYLKAL
jgi:hypothetical protein